VTLTPKKPISICKRTEICDKKFRKTGRFSLRERPRRPAKIAKLPL